MYIKTITPRQSEVITVPQLCNFARVDCPEQSTNTIPAITFPVVSGVVDGTNPIFTFPAPPTPNPPVISIYVGGIYQTVTSDYTLNYSNANTWTITFIDAPAIGPVTVQLFSGTASNTSPATLTDDWLMYQLFIDAATDTVESIAAQACLYEQILQTADYYPGQGDPRNYLATELQYAITATPYWWFGFPPKDSIELVRRPVLVPGGSPVTNNVTVTYVDPWGNPQTLDPSTCTVFADKITLNVGHIWPVTSRMADCVQVTYWAGYSATDPTQVPSQLRMAILFLAAHFVDVRQIVTIEPTSEVGMTLSRMLQSFKSYRVPR
jgi:hypothetical protein